MVIDMYNLMVPNWKRRRLGRLPLYEHFYMLQKRRYAKRYAHAVETWVRMLEFQGYPLYRVEIETINKCNGKCSFCPVSVSRDIRPGTCMTDRLFSRIVDDLSAIDYRGGFYFTSNNEGYMDPKIVGRMAEARGRMPHAYMVIYTNGTLLTREKYKESLKCLDMMMIDNYNDRLALNPFIYEALRDATPEEKAKTILMMRYEDEVLDTRGGFSPSRGRAQTLKIGCTNPFCEMVITPSGDASLCCQDIYNTHPMGNVGRDGVMGVWHGEGFANARKMLREKCREAFPICRECDFSRWSPLPDEDVHNLSNARIGSLEPLLRGDYGSVEAKGGGD